MVTITRDETVQRTTDQLMAEAPPVPVRVQAPVQAEPTLSPRVVQPLSVETPQSAPSAPPAEAVKETAKEVVNHPTIQEVLGLAPPAYVNMAPPAYAPMYPALTATPLPSVVNQYVSALLEADTAVRELDNLIPEPDFDFADAPIDIEQITPEKVLDVLRRTKNPKDAKIQALLPRILLALVDQCSKDDVSKLVEIASLVGGEGVRLAALESKANFDRLLKLTKVNAATPGTKPTFVLYSGCRSLTLQELRELVLANFQHPSFAQALKENSNDNTSLQSFWNNDTRLQSFRNIVRKYAFEDHSDLKLSGIAMRIFKTIEPGRYDAYLKNDGKLANLNYCENGNFEQRRTKILSQIWDQIWAEHCDVETVIAWFKDPSVDSYNSGEYFSKIADQICINGGASFYADMSSLIDVSPDSWKALSNLIDWQGPYYRRRVLNDSQKKDLVRIMNERGLGVAFYLFKQMIQSGSYTVQQEILRNPAIVEIFQSRPKEYEELCEFCKRPDYVLSKNANAQAVLTQAMEIVGQISQDDLAKIKLEQAALKK